MRTASQVVTEYVGQARIHAGRNCWVDSVERNLFLIAAGKADEEDACPTRRSSLVRGLDADSSRSRFWFICR